MNNPSEDNTKDGFGEIGSHFLVVIYKDSFVLNVEDDYWILQVDNIEYSPTQITPVLWTHDYWTITFSLVVDNFNVKYVGKKHANHLLVSVRQFYTVTEDWTQSLFSRMNLKWNYIEKHFNVYIPGYISAMLHRFQHIITVQRQDDQTHIRSQITVYYWHQEFTCVSGHENRSYT